MEGFVLKGNGDFLKLDIVEIFGFPDTTSYSGGYDTHSILEINSDDFKVCATIWISTGEYIEFYEQLLLANNELCGEVFLRNFEGNLECKIQYDINGHVAIGGVFSKQNFHNNKLNFYFKSDQSYIQATLKQLEEIVNKYGGFEAIKS